MALHDDGPAFSGARLVTEQAIAHAIHDFHVAVGVLAALCAEFFLAALVATSVGGPSIFGLLLV